MDAPVLGEAGVRQLLGRDGLHLDVHVDAVQQRPGDAVQVAAYLRGGAAALLGAAAQVPAGAGVPWAYNFDTINDTKMYCLNDAPCACAFSSCAGKRLIVRVFRAFSLLETHNRPKRKQLRS